MTPPFTETIIVFITNSFNINYSYKSTFVCVLNIVTMFITLNINYIKDILMYNDINNASIKKRNT